MTGSADRDLVVLVDDADTAIGTAEKLEAHRRGLKHRAISVLVKNTAGEFLLQRRALAKYHSGGLWTNACCSHPRPGEDALHAAHRRLKDEMGFDCAMTPMFIAQYRADVSDGLIENELVHVFAGTHDGAIAPDPDEIGDWKYVTLAALEADIGARPDTYTIWFRRYLAEHRDDIAEWLAS